MKRPLTRPMVRGLSRPLIRAGVHPLVTEFAKRSGATKLSVIDRVIKYVDANLDINRFTLTPATVGTNAYQGATLYNIGGLHVDDYTIFNGAPWSESDNGIVLDGATQALSMPDCLVAGTTPMVVWQRQNLHPDMGVFLWAQYDTTGNNRSFAVVPESSNSVFDVRVGEDGTSNRVNIAEADSPPPLGDLSFIAQIEANMTRRAWWNRSEVSLTNVGSNVFSRYNTSTPIAIGARANGAGFSGHCRMTLNYSAIYEGVITEEQILELGELLDEL